MIVTSNSCFGYASASNRKRIKVINLEEGTTHINLGTDSRTDLGKELCIYKNKTFTHPTLGKFESLVGLNYYLKSGRRKEIARSIYGIYHSGIVSDPVDSDFSMEAMFYDGIKAQCKTYPELQEALMATENLPLTNYHIFGGSLKSRPEYKLLLRAFGRYRTDSMKLIKGDLNVNDTPVTA